jgi:hypothetical protein
MSASIRFLGNRARPAIRLVIRGSKHPFYAGSDFIRGCAVIKRFEQKTHSKRFFDVKPKLQLLERIAARFKPALARIETEAKKLLPNVRAARERLDAKAGELAKQVAPVMAALGARRLIAIDNRKDGFGGIGIENEDRLRRTLKQDAKPPFALPQSLFRPL